MWSTISTWPFSLQAVKKAAEILENGGNAVDAAEAGIRLVESDPTVDSVARGGWLNANGELELDAAFMNGDTLRVGAVAAVKGFEHPVTIARAVMEKSRHNILVGKGAEEFADKMGIERADEERMILPAARKLYEENIAKINEEIKGHDTIGLIALDENGTIVCATSTSGASMKTPGRVGDSPIIGSGFYAQSGVGAAVATGLGEDIMRTCCCFRVVSLMEAGLTPQEAVEKAIADSTKIIQNTGYYCDNIAIVCMNAKGEVGASCNHVDFTYTHIREGIEPQVVEVQPVLDNGGRPREV
ncbi:MAG: N(4)-(beta-N-acetylglucosaminyl)-L-asparaginase [Clostridia bacterium]|nr:N(4)-(beta-N-acetylglucosaminyl)-L-asparaginase [Clostridia bacterium]